MHSSMVISKQTFQGRGIAIESKWGNLILMGAEGEGGGGGSVAVFLFVCLHVCFFPSPGSKRLFLPPPILVIRNLWVSFPKPPGFLFRSHTHFFKKIVCIL